jgi:hypothetical protein
VQEKYTNQKKEVINMKEYVISEKRLPRCKMSIYREEIYNQADICAMHLDVICDGLLEERRNCPFWRLL